MKVSAFEQLAAIHDERHLKEVLEYLSAIAAAEQKGLTIKDIVKKAAAEYGPVLAKLAQ
jgi:hypothetical protein